MNTIPPSQTRSPSRKWDAARVIAALAMLAVGPAAVMAADSEIIFSFWGDYHLSASSTFQLDEGIAQLAGDFDAAINDPARFDLTNSTLQLVGFPNAGPYDIEAMAEDIGFCDLSLPDPNLYSMKRLWVGPSTVRIRFVDNHDNAAGVGNEAIYVDTLRFEPGTRLDVRGINLYYITVIPADAGEPGSGVTITDSVGGGGIFALGTDSPVTPINPGTSDNEICDGDSTTLFATANPGLEIDWYTDDCGISPSNRPLGTFVGTGSPLVVSPLDTTAYWAQSRNPSTGCISRICSDSVTVIVHDNPLCNITSDAVVCTGASELTATVEDAGANTTYDWSVTGGAITGGNNTPTITYVADDVGSILLEVTIDKTYSEGDGSVCQTYCQLTIYTDRYVWTGPDGASFIDPANWDLNIVPGSIPPGGDAIITNNTNVDNRCVLDDPGAEHLMCNIKIRTTGSGRQIVQINSGSILTASVATLIDVGGEIDLRNGEIAGGPITNLSNTIRGYGLISADLLNDGLLTGSPLQTMELTSSLFDNQDDGKLLAQAGAGFLLNAATIQQAGEMEIHALGGVFIPQSLTNLSGGLITLYGGVLASNGLTNDVGADVAGTGTIDCSIINDGNLTTIADTLIVGDVANEGVITIQNGLLTITGMLSGSGTIIGGFGGRGGDQASLGLGGDFLPAVTDPARFDMTTATLRLTGGSEDHPQQLEVMAADRGTGGVTLPDESLFSIGTLRIGTAPATVQLVDTIRNSSRDARKRQSSEALYVGHLILDPGATLDLAGRTLYYDRVTPANPQADGSGVHVIDTVGGGSLQPLRSRPSKSGR